jgi:hypothetical protein
MGYISWTKTWTSGDDGSILTGAQIGQLQADIAAILNGGITNVNVGASAAIAESKLAFDTSAGHNHDGSNSKTISATNVLASSTLKGAILKWLSTTTCKATSGSIVINGVLYSRTSDSTTRDISVDADYIGGISSRGTSKWLYVYAYNDTGTSWDIKFSASAPQYSNCGTDTSDILRFRQISSVWYRCIGAIYLNATGSGEITAFTQYGDWVNYDVAIEELTTGSAASWTDVDCSSSIPVFSTLGNFYLYAVDSNTTGWYLRRNGVSAATGCFTFNGEVIGQSAIIFPTDSSQIIEYVSAGSGGTLSISVLGYYMGGLR